MKKTITILLTALFAAIAPCVNARVFSRWGAAAHSAQLLQDIGGRIAYKCSMNINGGSGQVAVFGFQQPLPELMQQLRNAFGPGNFCYSGGNMGTISLQDGNTSIQLIAIEISCRSIVFHIERPAVRTSEKHLMTALPPFPGSVPVFYAKDENTLMSLSVSSSIAQAGAVREFYRSVLTSSGWSGIIPESGNSQSDALLYVRGNYIACVLVESPGDSGETRITLLHKQQEFK